MQRLLQIFPCVWSLRGCCFGRHFELWATGRKAVTFMMESRSPWGLLFCSQFVSIMLSEIEYAGRRPPRAWAASLSWV